MRLNRRARDTLRIQCFAGPELRLPSSSDRADLATLECRGLVYTVGAGTYLTRKGIALLNHQL